MQIISPPTDRSVSRSLQYYTITFSATGLFVLLCAVVLTSAEYYKAKKQSKAKIIPSLGHSSIFSSLCMTLCCRKRHFPLPTRLFYIKKMRQKRTKTMKMASRKDFVRMHIIGCCCDDSLLLELIVAVSAKTLLTLKQRFSRGRKNCVFEGANSSTSHRHPTTLPK